MLSPLVKHVEWFARGGTIEDIHGHGLPIGCPAIAEYIVGMHALRIEGYEDQCKDLEESLAERERELSWCLGDLRECREELRECREESRKRREELRRRTLFGD